MQQNKTLSLDSDLIHRTLSNIVARNKGENFSSVVSECLEKWNQRAEAAQKSLVSK